MFKKTKHWSIRMFPQNKKLCKKWAYGISFEFLQNIWCKNNNYWIGSMVSQAFIEFPKIGDSLKDQKK